MPYEPDATSRPRRALGKPVHTFAASAAYLQRAAIVAVLSFSFFLMMIAVFSIRQKFGYFLLAGAFLIVYFFTMFGLWTQKRNVLIIYENGISYKKFVSRWDMLESVDETVNSRGDRSLTLCDKGGVNVIVPPAIENIGEISEIIRVHVKR